jgi:hypothetical protein
MISTCQPSIDSKVNDESKYQLKLVPWDLQVRLFTTTKEAQKNAL